MRPGAVNLDALTALAEITATRWKEFSAEVGGSALSCRAERWVLDGVFDFMELSIVSDRGPSGADQAALHFLSLVTQLTVEQSQENKTQRVVSHLVARPA